MKIYSHYRDFPVSKWRWKYFTPFELRSKGDNKLAVNEDAMDKLQRLRVLLGRPIYITSAYRSPYHNRKVGGAKYSKHLEARAFDCQMHNHDTEEFVRLARQVGFTGFGYYPKSKNPFIHIDTARPRSWGTFWKADNRKGEASVEKPQPQDSPKPSWFVVLIEALIKALK